MQPFGFDALTAHGSDAVRQPFRPVADAEPSAEAQQLLCRKADIPDVAEHLVPCDLLGGELALQSCLIGFVGRIAGHQIQLSQGCALPEGFQVGADRMHPGPDAGARRHATLHLVDCLRLNVHAVDLLRSILPLHEHGDNPAAGTQVADPFLSAVG